MKKVNTVLKTTAFFVLGSMVYPGIAFAADQTNIEVAPPIEFNTLNKVTFATMVSGAISLILIVAALVFFFSLVIGGIQWILTSGEKAGAEAARKRITGALVGLGIVFAAWAIGTLINTLFKVNIFNLNLPTFIGK